MSNEAKVPAMTSQEAEDVAAFLILRRTGREFSIDYAGGVWTTRVFDGRRSTYGSRETLTDAVLKLAEKLAEKLPDVFDSAKGE
jgi:hypothetical protein